jgi:hypothetical protein
MRADKRSSGSRGLCYSYHRSPVNKRTWLGGWVLAVREGKRRTVSWLRAPMGAPRRAPSRQRWAGMQSLSPICPVPCRACASCANFTSSIVATAAGTHHQYSLPFTLLAPYFTIIVAFYFHIAICLVSKSHRRTRVPNFTCPHSTFPLSLTLLS